MQNSRKETLEQWIREALTDAENKEAKTCTSIALMHIVGNVDREVYTVKFGGKQWSEKELAKLFRGKAENYAADMSGVQMFVLLAFYDGRGEPQARKPFRVQPASEAETAQQMTEGPTREGLVSQMMRHNEAMAQMMFKQTSMLFASLNQQLEVMGRERANYMRESADAFTIVKEMMLQRDNHQHEQRMKQLEFIRSSEERKQWLKFGPALINTLIGREVFPVASQDTALIESIAENLSADDLQKIAASGIIKPQVLGPLAERLASYLKQKRMIQEEHERVLQEDLEKHQLANGKDTHRLEEDTETMQ